MNKVVKKIFIIISIVIITTLLFTTAVYIYLIHNKQRVVNEITDQINSKIEGVVEIDNITAGFIKSYPMLEVSLQDTKLYEDSIKFREDSELLRVEEIKFKINPFKIFNKAIDVNSLTLSNVEAEIYGKGGGKFNFDRAIKLRKDNLQSQGKHTLFNFNIDKLRVDDIDIEYITNSTSKSLNIESIDATLTSRDSLLIVDNSKMELYNTPILFKLTLNEDSRECVVDLTLNDNTDRTKGVITFDGESNVYIDMAIDCSLPLKRYKNLDLSGNIEIKGVINSRIDIDNEVIIGDKSLINISLDDIEGSYNQLKLPNIERGSLIFENQRLEGKNLDVKIGVNRLTTNFHVDSLLKIVNRSRDFSSDLNLEVKAKEFNTYMMRERLGLTIDTLTSIENLHNLTLSLKSELTPQNLPPLSKSDSSDFTIFLTSYNATLPDSSTISDVNGKIHLLGMNRINIDGLSGKIKGDRFKIGGYVDFNLNGQSKGVFKYIEAKLKVESEKLQIDDMFFSELSFSKALKIERDSLLKARIVYGASETKGMEMENLSSNIKIKLLPPTKIPSSTLDNYKMEFNKLNCTIDGVKIKLDSHVERYGSRVSLNNSRITYDNIPAHVDGVIWVGDTTKNDTINIRSEVAVIEKRHRQLAESAKKSKYPKNMVLGLDFEEIQLFGQRLKKVKGEVLVGKLGRNFKLKDLDINFAGGEIDINGDIAVKSAIAKQMEKKSDQYVANLDIEYKNIDFSEINYSQLGKLSQFKNKIDGSASGEIKGEIIVSDLGKLNLNTTFVTIYFDITNVNMWGFDPPEKLKRYLKRINTGKIEIKALSNTILIDRGVVSIPNMNIQSSIGNYSIEGEADMCDNSLSFVLDVPLNVVGRAALGLVFGDKSGKIREINDKERKHYVRFYIDGRNGKYDVALRDKNEKKRERKNDRKEK